MNKHTRKRLEKEIGFLYFQLDKLYEHNQDPQLKEQLLHRINVLEGLLDD